MRLPEGEPAGGPWEEIPLDDLLGIVRAAAGPVDGRPLVLAVDGRGAGGKSTLARRVARAVGGAVVSTDDVAWHHGFFSWDGLLAEHVLEPVRRGDPVSFRPPAWVERGREGAIEVPAGLDLVVVEGVGASRRSLSSLLDASIWVQSDFDDAERRGIERDVAEGLNGDRAQAQALWDEWMTHELPFLADDRPWERACAVADGTWSGDPSQVRVSPAP